MNFERLTSSYESVLEPMSKSPTSESPLDEMSHSGDVVILQEAPKSPCSVQKTCTESDSSLSPGTLKRRRLSIKRSINSASSLGPFPSPVPTFTFRTEPQPSPKSGSDI